MSLPTISGTARLTAAPELKFAASGTAVCRINLAFNSRKKQDDGTWIDDKTFFVTGVLFKQAAESVAETLDKGHEVVVTGRLCTEQWESKTGEKRSAPSLLIDSIGPAVNNIQTARVSKLDRTNGGQTGSGFGSQRQQAPAGGDPWASTTAPTRNGGGFDEQPPF